MYCTVACNLWTIGWSISLVHTNLMDDPILSREFGWTESSESDINDDPFADEVDSDFSLVKRMRSLLPGMALL